MKPKTNSPKKDMPLSVRRREERAMVAEVTEPRGLIMRWVQSHACFIAAMPAIPGTWAGGFTSCTMKAHEAVTIELFIAEKTASIIGALAATAKGGAL